MKNFLLSVSVVAISLFLFGCDTIRHAGRIDATLTPDAAMQFEKDYFESKGYKKRKGGIFPPKGVAFYKAELPSGKNITIEFHHNDEKNRNAYSVFVCCGYPNDVQIKEIDDKVKEIEKELQSKTDEKVSTETFLVTGRF